MAGDTFYGLFPLARAYDDPSEMEEERRLFYVGITRAEDKLFLTHARQRRRAEWLLGRFIWLGPAFVKVGQTLSTRPDLLPLTPDGLEELAEGMRVVVSGPVPLRAGRA